MTLTCFVTHQRLLFGVLNFSSPKIFGEANKSVLSTDVAETHVFAGEDMNCKNEGEIVRVDFLTENPCFGCVCRVSPILLFRPTAMCSGQLNTLEVRDDLNFNFSAFLGLRFAKSHLLRLHPWNLPNRAVCNFVTIRRFPRQLENKVVTDAKGFSRS